MAAHWDTSTSHPVLASHNGYRSQTSTFHPPLSEPLAKTRPSIPRVPEHHGPATTFSPPSAEDDIVPVPYYEAYTIRPDDLASSKDRWSLPPKKSIPATQVDLHTEVFRQRQSGRTACRELEDCHGPKRQYIDRLIRERNASTTSGHFEVAQLRLERIPKDFGKAADRSSGRNYHARDYKQKDSTRPRQRTVYMHVILQFIGSPNRSPVKIQPEILALRNPNVSYSHRSATPHTPDVLILPRASEEMSPVLPEASHQATLARAHAYTMGRELEVSPASSRYISRGTQTQPILSAHTRPHSDWCSDENTNDDATLGNDPVEDTWTTTSNVEDEMPRKSPSSDDDVVSMGDSASAHESANESTVEESRGIDEYEKPSWFQNLQPVKTPGLMDEQLDVCYQPDEGESSSTREERDTDVACEQHGEEISKAYGDGDAGCTQPTVCSWSEEKTGQSSPDIATGHTEDVDNDQSRDYSESEGTLIATESRELSSVDEHPSSGPAEIPMSEYTSKLPGSPPPEKIPPSERYKPRYLLNPAPARPSLTRASATYDSRPNDDSERRSSKRVSFQQPAAPLYTPPSTTTSSPVSPSASPQLPFRIMFAKPPAVSIPPGQYTPIASSSPVSPLSPPAARKPYTCLEPTCDSSFDHPYDRDRHERQHDIGDPPYSACPICHHSRSNGAAVEVGLREMLIAHMNRRH